MTALAPAALADIRRPNGGRVPDLNRRGAENAETPRRERILASASPKALFLSASLLPPPLGDWEHTPCDYGAVQVIAIEYVPAA